MRGAPASLRRSRCWCEKPKVESCWSVKTHGRVRFHFLRMGIYTEMVCVFHRSWVLRSDSGRTKKSRNSLSILAEMSLGRSHFEGRADLADGDDDGLEAESQDRRSECRRCREHGYIERRVDQEGHEAEESPEAPRAVRARGEVPLEVQGVQCLSARSSALSVQGVRWVSICEHGRQRSSARSAVGHQSASTVVVRSRCKECGGSRICEHGRQRSKCKECGGSSICEHGRRRSRCKECASSTIVIDSQNENKPKIPFITTTPRIATCTRLPGTPPGPARTLTTSPSRSSPSPPTSRVPSPPPRTPRAESACSARR